MRSRPAAVVLALACLLGAPAARADARTDLEKARVSFLSKNWADAEVRLRAILDPQHGVKDRAILSQARMYLGAVLNGQGRTDEAKELFEKLARDDPGYDPDPLGFPADAINTFIDVRAALVEQIRIDSVRRAREAAEKKAREDAEREAERLWLEKVKAQAGERDITVRNSRIVASIPFGVGQFQNQQHVLGGIFAGVELGALVGMGITTLMYRYARDRENEELNGTNQLAAQWHNRAEDIRIVNLSLLGGFLGAAAIGIVQANLSYVPERAEKRSRPLPPLEPAPRMSSIAPVVSVLPGRDGTTPAGMVLGVRGLAF